MTDTTNIEQEQTTTANLPDNSLRDIPTVQIRRNPNIDPRQHRNKARLATMLESFKREGIIQPITIRPVEPTEESPATFEVVAGNTRYEGAVSLGMETIPALIRHVSAKEAIVMAGVENMQRQDLSPVEEGHHAAHLLSAQKNDYQEVCNLLDWSEAKLKSRIMLTHVDDFVQNALVQGDLKIGHVELLSGVPQRQQSSIAKKIIERGYSVADTRERLAQGKRQLSKACFSLEDCQGCRFNSSTMGDMFASSEGAEKDFCSNAACWDEKTEKALSIITTDAQEEYGTVFRQNEVPSGGHVTLEAHGENGVGQEQLASCASCQHYGCIISTTFGSEGQAWGEQCFNLECHGEKVTQYRSMVTQASQAPEAPQEAPATGQASTAPAGGETPSAPKKDDTATKAALSPATVKKGIKGEAMKRFAMMGEQAIAGSERLGSAIALLTLHSTLQEGGYAKEVSEKASDILKRLEVEASNAPAISNEVGDNKALRLARLSIEEINQAMTQLAALTVWREDAQGKFERHAPYQNAARYAQARNIPRQEYLAITPAYLKAQTKPAIIEDCKNSGFADAYDEEKGEKAFQALAKGKVSDLLKEIETFSQEGSFDWHGYEPDIFTPSFYFDGM